MKNYLKPYIQIYFGTIIYDSNQKPIFRVYGFVTFVVIDFSPGSPLKTFITHKRRRNIKVENTIIITKGRNFFENINKKREREREESLNLNTPLKLLRVEKISPKI